MTLHRAHVAVNIRVDISPPWCDSFRGESGREPGTRPLKEVCPAWSDHGSLPDVCHHRGLGSIPGPMSTETFPIRHDIALTSSVTEIDHLLAQLPCYGTGHRSKLNWLLLRTSLGHQSFISRVSINPPVSISPLTVILSYASPSSAPLGRTLTAV